MKKIVLLGAGIEQISVIQLAKKLGYKAYVLDANPNAPGINFAYKYIPCDISSVDKVFRISKKIKPDGIFVHAIELSHVVAEVSSRLNLPGISPNSANNATDKLKRIKIFKKYKISCPEFGTAKSILVAKKVAKDIGYPLVIKPIDNAGSRGVLFIKNQTNLERYFPESVKQSKVKKEILIEEFLSGPQISTETVVYNSNFYTTGFSDRNYSNVKEYLPYFVEDGGDTPSTLPSTIKKKTIDLVEKTIRALKLDFGAAKGDIVIHNNKPYVFEMASRTSGGWFASHQIPASTGVNILKPLLNMAVIDDVDLTNFTPKFLRHSSQRYVIPKPGKIVSITGLDKAKKMTGIIEIKILSDLKIGDVVPSVSDNLPRSKKIMILAVGKTRKETSSTCENARNLIRIKTKPIVTY